MNVAQKTIGWTTAIIALGLAALGAIAPAEAQVGQARPPAVGVMEAVKRPITESNDFVGRIESPNRVSVVARVTAFLKKRYYIEGSEVKAGDMLYQLERGRCRNQLQGRRHCGLRWHACREFNTHFPGANALCDLSALARSGEAAVG